MLNSKFWIWTTRPAGTHALELSLHPVLGYQLCFNLCPWLLPCWSLPCLCACACAISSWNFHLCVSPAFSNQILCIPLAQLSRYLSPDPLLLRRLGVCPSCLHPRPVLDPTEPAPPWTRIVGLLVCPGWEVTCSLNTRAVSWSFVSVVLMQSRTGWRHLISVSWAGFCGRGGDRLF